MPTPLPDASARAAARAGLEGDRMAAWRGFIGAHARVLQNLSQELQEEESLPLTWYDVLVQLSEADGHRLRMQELAQRVLLSQSGLTRLIDRMEEAGLVERLRCPEDGRGLNAQLTDAGLSTLRRTYPTHLRGVRAWFSDLLSDEEAATLARALGRIEEHARPSAGPEGTGPTDGR